MKQHMHQLKNEEIQSQLRAILDECKADKKPVHLACEEHGEYVVIDRNAYRDVYSKAQMLKTMEAIQRSEVAIAAGQTMPIDEAFAEIKRRHGI